MKKLTLFTVLFSLFFIGCSDDDEVGTFGPTQAIVGFPQTSIAKNFLTDVPSQQFTVPVGLITYPNETLPGALSVQWSVDPSSTAIPGVEYDIVASNSITIPAGSSIVNIPFVAYPTTLDPDVPKTLVLNVTSNNAIVGAQYKKVVITLQGVCPSNLEGTYFINYTTGPVYSEVSSIGNGMYRASYMPTFASTYWFEFSDVCNVLTITNFEFAANPASGTGVVLPNGDLAFSGVNVAGVSWYVNRSWTLRKL